MIEARNDEETNLSDEGMEEFLLSLPKERGYITPHQHQYQYEGFWCVTAELLQGVIAFQKHFQAQDSDIVVASIPKSGTTWLKALTFAIVNRHRFEIKTHPLLTSSSHDLVPFLEVDLYLNNLVPDFSSKFLEPRLFGTHIPYASLGSIKESNCKIVYVCRNPFDMFVSFWHFANKAWPESLALLSLEEAFDMFCQGKHPYGPFWDQILGYWEESVKRPQNVLFFKYEDMKKDIVLHLKRLAEFLNYPFTVEEESNGLIEDIANLCSFETMKELEINKTGTFVMDIENKALFRKAKVGDWVNYFTPIMKERMTKIIEEKLESSGLTFKMNLELADSVQQN